MDKEILGEALSRLCARHFGGDANISNLQRLSGGANMESWGFDYGDLPLVLRRMPGNGESDDNIPRLSIASEAKLIALAESHGVTAPPMLGVLEPKDGLGKGFLMRRIAGEALPHKILGNPDFAAAENALPRQCAEELARIHAIPLDTLPDDTPRADAATLLSEIHQRYKDYGAAIPVFDYAFRWLQDNLPATTDPCLLHGDFRMGNLLIDNKGISAILDWELAHIGDPVQDLAYLCTPSWRFTRHDRGAGGFGAIDDLISAYETASGAPVDRARFDYWLIYSTLWWGNVCLNMTDIWRSGMDRSLERTVIGRRTSEVEIDLLLLFDPLLGDTAKVPIDWQEPAMPNFAGETDNAELLEALVGWASEGVIDTAKGRALFEARVARNALGILKRDALYGARFAESQQQRLDTLDLSFEALRAGLSDGTITLDQHEILTHLRLSALERLTIDQPKYPGRAEALGRWRK